MSGKFPPLEYRDVVRGLKRMGFEERKQKATSHAQWVKFANGRIFKVTVDRPKAPYGPILILSMASQAGVSKKEFYKQCKK